MSVRSYTVRGDYILCKPAWNRGMTATWSGVRSQRLSGPDYSRRVALLCGHP